MCQDDIANDEPELDRVAFAVDLANTWDIWFDDPERLGEPATLDAFLREHGVIPDAPVTERELADVREVRRSLRDVFQSSSAHEAADRLRAMLDGVVVQPEIRFVERGSDDVLVTYAPVPRAPLGVRVRTLAGLGTVAALQRWGARRLRSCEADRCEDVFVDTSRNGRRRYCNVRCQNRFNVAALRQRASAAGTSRDERLVSRVERHP